MTKTGQRQQRSWPALNKYLMNCFEEGPVNFRVEVMQSVDWWVGAMPLTLPHCLRTDKESNAKLKPRRLISITPITNSCAQILCSAKYQHELIQHSVCVLFSALWCSICHLMDYHVKRNWTVHSVGRSDNGNPSHLSHRWVVIMRPWRCILFSIKAIRPGITGSVLKSELANPHPANWLCAIITKWVFFFTQLLQKGSECWHANTCTEQSIQSHCSGDTKVHCTSISRRQTTDPPCLNFNCVTVSWVWTLLGH